MDSHPISSLIRKGEKLFTSNSMLKYSKEGLKLVHLGPHVYPDQSQGKKTTSNLGHVSTIVFKKIKYIIERSKGCWASQKEIPMF